MLKFIIKKNRKNSKIRKIVLKNKNKIIDKIGFIFIDNNCKKISINIEKFKYWYANGANFKNKRIFLLIIKFILKKNDKI